MGIMDKIFFWKKDDLAEEKPLELGLGNDTTGLPPVPEEPNFEEPSAFSQQQTSTMNKDLELISAKLDALKPLLESMNQRLTNIERIAQEAEKNEEVY